VPRDDIKQRFHADQTRVRAERRHCGDLTVRQDNLDADRPLGARVERLDHVVREQDALVGREFLGADTDVHLKPAFHGERAIVAEDGES